MVADSHDAGSARLHLEWGLFVLVCECGWRSLPVRAVGIGPAWDGHMAAVAGVWPGVVSHRDEKFLASV